MRCVSVDKAIHCHLVIHYFVLTTTLYIYPRRRSERREMNSFKVVISRRQLKRTQSKIYNWSFENSSLSIVG